MLLRTWPALARLLLLACLAGMTLVPGASPRRAGAQTLPPPVGVGYRWVGTWTGVPPRPGPGRFGDAADISSAPDGTVYVLDRAQNALHVIDPAGHPRAWWPYPAGEDSDGGTWRWMRLDVGSDGRPYVLARGTFPAPPPTMTVVRYRVDVLSLDGTVQARHALGSVAPERYVDLAVRADQRVFLTHTSGNVARLGTFGIEVLAPDGTHAALPIGAAPLTIPLTLDVGADGTIYVVDQFPHSAVPPGPGKVDGVAVFDPDGTYRRTIQFTGAMDVAVGAAGLFVSKDNEIYRLEDTELLYGGPTVQKNPYRLTSLGVPSMFSLDVPVSGGGPLRAAMTHCSFQGILSLDVTGHPSGPIQPTFAGALDLPSLRGPVYPLRIDAGRQLALLQGRFEPAAGPDLPPAPFFSQLYSPDPQTVQHWGPDGTLLGQMGTCGVWNAPLGVADLAVDGGDVYTIDAHSITRRPDDHAPDWQRYGLEFLDDPLALPHLTAVAADGGRVAALDVGAQTVLVLDAAGELVGSWSYANLWDEVDSARPIPVDIALAGSRLVLAHGGLPLIAVFDLDRPGTTLREMLSHSQVTETPIRAAAVGPTGEILVLATDGWVYRYRADRHEPDSQIQIETAWPLPDAGVSARDIAVDDTGRVYVTWVDAAEPGGEALNLSQHVDIRRAGVWAFEPFTAIDSAAGVRLDNPDCVKRADKAIDPQAIRLGEAITVTLRVDGACRGAYKPLQLAIVFNTAKQMNNDNAIDRAKSAVISLVKQLDPDHTNVSLMTFADQARLDVPFAGPPQGGLDAGHVAATVASLEASEEGTDLAGALELARAELARVRGDGGIGQAVLVVTDGGPLAAGDDPTAAAADLRADGVALYAEVHPPVGLEEADLDGLVALVGDKERIFTTYTPEAIDAQHDALAIYTPSTRLPFDSVRIADVLPANIRYVAASAEPPAAYDPATRTLTWEALPADQASVTVRYRIEPLNYGSWLPVALHGTAATGTGEPIATFPIPIARVRGAGEAFLPIGRLNVR